MQYQVATLENFIQELKRSDAPKREELLNNFGTSDYSTDSYKFTTILESDNTKNSSLISKTEIVVDKLETGQISVHQKPLIYMPTDERKTNKTKSTDADFQFFQCPTIMKYISNFFKWQYMDHNLYIYRESFLTDFFKESDDMKESLPYCNEELIYAICACGSVIDFGSDVFMYKGVLYDSPDKFYNRSRYLLFRKLNSDDCNSITAVQTFLCLAFYDLGRGRTLSAWVLSGIAFRIGIHMGFELNLEESSDKKVLYNNMSLTEYDMNVRSRIYWGSRVADYFISFALGRSPSLEHLDATIPKSENLPILQGIEYFLYYDPVKKDSKISNISKPLEQINILYGIVYKYHKKIYCESSTNDLLQFQKFHFLQQFNLEAYEWKSNLIDELYWSKSELKYSGYNPNQMAFRYQYYMIILSMNRDFVSILENDSGTLLSRDICLSSIEDVYYSILCFRNHHSLRYVSLTMVYVCILSLTILQKLPDSINFTIQRSVAIDFFASVLKDCSPSWDLARSAYNTLYKVNSSTKSPPILRKEPEQQDDINDLDESLIPSLNYA